MTYHFLINIIAVTIGFCAALFFCIGNLINTSEKIIIQATTYFNFNEHVARSLAAQRAQYITGAILLLISFLLQVVAVQASPTNLASLPQYIQSCGLLIVVVLFSTLATGCLFSEIIRRTTIAKIKKHIEQIQ